MNEKAKTILKNLSYTVSANFLVLGISVIINLIVPKFLGVHEYSYWQLYVFYSGYVGFFHIGWLDGIYLKIGGEEYDELDKKSLGSQFWYLLFFESILTLGVSVYVYMNVHETYKMNILLLTSILLIVMNCKTYVLFIFQSTNRIKEYARLSRDDRYIYTIFLMVYLLFGGKNFIVLILLDIFSKLITTIWGLNRINDIIYLKPQKLKLILPEVIDNIKIGSNLMVSNIANLLIIGITRFFVEQKWSIVVFGKLSFTLSISNMFMTFINAVGIIMFPMLRRTDKEYLPKVYKNLRIIFVPFTLLLLLLFNPISIILEMWLPEYKQSLYFMGILFPIIVYEGRMSLLINTYLKTLRKEKIILTVNLITLIITLISSFVTVFVVEDITLTVLVIIFCLAFRCILAELLLCKFFEYSLFKTNIWESILVLIFIFGNMCLTNINSFIVYLLCILLYILLTLKNVIYSIKWLSDLMKN